MSKVSETKHRFQEAAKKRMENIYAECDKRGLSRRFLDRCYFRLVENPLNHTKSVIAESERASKYNGNSTEKLLHLKTSLEIMLFTNPQHEKADEWKQSLTMLENNNK